VFETFPWIRILEFGLPGLAVVLLYLAFHLLKSQRPDSAELASLETDAQIDAWRDAHRTTSVNIRTYFGLSAMFFFGGLFIAIFQPRSEIILSVSPREGPVMPKILLQEEDLPGTDGVWRINVSNDNTVRIVNNALLDRILQLQSEREELQRRLTELELVRLGNDPETGI
jgi:hypothetical protein